MARTRKIELVIELGEPVLDAIDTEARRLSVVEDRCVQGGHDAAHAKGKAEMDDLFTGWPINPPMPVEALPPGPFTVDRKRAPRAIEPTTPKRVRKSRKAKVSAPTGDAA